MTTENIEGFSLAPQQRTAWPHFEANSDIRNWNRITVLVYRSLQPANLKAAINHVIEKYEILRTDFSLLKGISEPVQTIRPLSNFSLEVLDLSDMEKTNAEEYYNRRSETRLSDTSSDNRELLHDGQIEVKLISLPDDQCYLELKFLPLSIDSRSMMKVVDEIVTFSLSETSDKEPTDPIQFAEISAWLNDILEDEEAISARQYWKNFEQVIFPRQQLRFEVENPFNRKIAISTQSITLNKALLEKISRLAKNYETSLETICFAAWALLIKKMSKGDSPVIAKGYDGVTDELLDESIGPLTRYLPIDISTGEETVLTEFVAKIHERLEQAYEYQECFSWKDFDYESILSKDENYFSYCFEFYNLSNQSEWELVRFTFYE